VAPSQCSISVSTVESFAVEVPTTKQLVLLEQLMLDR